MATTQLTPDEEQLLKILKQLYWEKAPMLTRCHNVHTVTSRWPGYAATAGRLSAAVDSLIAKGLITLENNSICLTDDGLRAIGVPVP